MIYIGTSGWSYDDWVGPFYPEDTNKRQFLDYYAERYSCVEVNFTYYRMPNASTMEAISNKTGSDFRFTVKAPGEFTHERSAREDAYDEFRAGIRPIMDDGKLGCVLAQFPYSFKPNDAARRYLTYLGQNLSDLPVVVEFRNSKWVGPRTFDLLRNLNMGYCSVDGPRISKLMPPIAETTANVSYVRFHGRNADNWFEHDEAWQRYDYLYDAEELQEWTSKVDQLDAKSEDCYLFFNNHYQAKATQNADLFAQLLRDADVMD